MIRDRASAMTHHDRSGWEFLTNHAHVLITLARDPHRPLYEVAAEVGLTTRATQALVADLIAAGYVCRTRVGRSNHYEAHTPVSLSPTRSVDDLILLCEAVSSGSSARTPRGRRPRVPRRRDQAIGPSASPARLPRAPIID